MHSLGFAMSQHSTALSDFENPTSSGRSKTLDDRRLEGQLGAFTINEFGRIFRLSRGSIYKLKNAGKLRFAKVGTRTVITVTEAKRFQRTLDEESERA